MEIKWAKKAHLFAMAALSSSTIMGCVYNYQVISEPYIQDATEWKITRWTWSTVRHAVLHSPNLSITVYPHNGSDAVGVMLFPIPGIPFPYGEPANKKLFKISIIFGESIDHWRNVPPHLEFNPSKTVLKLANGQIFLPSGLASPKSDNCMYSGEAIRFYSDTDKWIALPEGHKKNCIDLIYTVSPPSPQENFDIAVLGLRKNHQEVVVPTLHFKEGVLNPWPPGS